MRRKAEWMGRPTDDESTTDGVPAAERAALVDLYLSTGGDMWSNKGERWNTDAPVGTWGGVGCLDGHVISLDLWKCGLTGEIPASIADLTDLEQVYLPNNDITAIPKEIGAMTKLEGLNLRANRLTSVPAELGNLSALEAVDLSENPLTSLPAELVHWVASGRINASATPFAAREVGDEHIVGADPRVTVLSDAATVFAEDQQWLGRVVHPLVSIELSAVNPQWHGRVHLLSPVEPTEEGYLGDATLTQHNAHTAPNWIAFHLDDDDRYHFLGERRYFAIEDGEAGGTQDTANLVAQYAEAERQLADTKTRWAQTGSIREREEWDEAVLIELGGNIGYGNWADYPPPPPAYVLDSTDPDIPVLRLADGRPCTFIGWSSGYPWREDGADAILLFFEPETRTAILTFDWS
jgi:hypothetical protein